MLVKVALLGGAMLLAAVNLLWTRPRLQARPATGRIGPATATLLRRLVGAEIVLVAAIIFAAAVLSSLPPPAKALARVGGATAHVGPGPRGAHGRAERLHARAQRHAEPGRAPNTFALVDHEGRQPVTGAERDRRLRDAGHGDGRAGVRLSEIRAGRVHAFGAGARHGRPLGDQVPRRAAGRQPFDVLLVDRANG